MASMEKGKQRAHSSSNTRTMYDLSKLTSDDVLGILDPISNTTDIEDDILEGDFDDDDSVADPGFCLPKDQINKCLERMDLSLFGIFDTANRPSAANSTALTSSSPEPSTSAATNSDG